MNSVMPHHRRSSRGYTFAEVLVASALLGLAIGGAVSLTATMNTQHTAALTQAVAYNYQDNGARLWQLGLTDAEALALLPDVRDNSDLQNAIVPTSTSADKQLSFTAVTNTTLATSMGTVEKTTCTATIRNPIGASTNRNISVDAYRAKIR
jgi:Tfp pilus assembly protein PilV